MSGIFETVMLVCFGLSWPLNVIKAYKARTAKGTSLPFILLIITGYIAGITAKLISGQVNYVLVVYLLNLAIVSLNVLVYIRNAALDRKTAHA
ncbi:MAG: hypothetical protein IJZ56_02075 [Oscillospiraceae bacterium]|nr:hypothetical protein [Oscillospiraceae bacterium]